MNPEDDAVIEKALPFVFISGESIDKLMSNKNVSIKHLGTFDNNWRKKRVRPNNPDLVREGAVIMGKTEETEEAGEMRKTEGIWEARIRVE
jgi:hypothetical protein